MSAISSQPATPNFLSPLNFDFQVKKLPGVNFFAQKVNIPGITLPSPPIVNPNANIPTTGDHITFDELVVTFKLDENLQNWFEIWNWIRGMGFPTDSSEYEYLESKPIYSGEGLYSDIAVLISDSAKNPKFECTFLGAFPIALSSFEMDSTATDVNFVTCQATFIYSNYTMQAIS